MTAETSLVAGGCLLPLFFGSLSLLLKPNNHLASTAFLVVSVLLVAASTVSSQHPITWCGPEWLSIGPVPVTLTCDPLAAGFLLVIAIVGTCCAIYSPSYLDHLAQKVNTRFYWTALFVFMAGMIGVLLAANAAIFLVAWEAMAIASAALVVSDFQQHKAQRAAFIYIVATRIATLFVSAGFLLMYSKFHDWAFASWSFTEPSTWIAATMLLIGLIIKAGVWPFHIWLPHAHPVAPSPVSALMSAVMVKIAVYAVIRFFVCGHLTCQPLIYFLFALSCISSFWGILFAINQRELKRLLAYSTVENVGLILLAVSLCLWCRNIGLDGIAQIALFAALFHAFSHALLKSMLFLCAGSVDFAAHTREFAMLGGLAKVLPITGAMFVLGGTGICALPPLNGFVGKWCLYQALLQCCFTMPNSRDRAICILTIGLLSGVGALAVGCFAKAIGVSFLGRARSKQAEHAHDVPTSMKLPVVLLGAASMASGVLSPLLVTPVLTIVATALGTAPTESRLLVPIPLWQLAGAMIVLLSFIYGLLLRSQPASYRTWDCGFGKAPGKSQVTADSFAQPIARIFAPVLQYKLTVEVSGNDRRHFPEKIVVEPSMISLLETKVYGPAASLLDKLSRAVAKLQTGSIHLYLLYLCIALVLLVFAGVWLW